MQKRTIVLGATLVGALACGGSSPVVQNKGPPAHALTVAVAGSGSVTSAPGGINCDGGESQGRGTTCTASFAAGTSVALTAAPASGAVFSGWDGACSGTGACTVAMIADAAVTARFSAVPPLPGQNFTVTVTTSGSGAVKSSPAGIDCGNTCSGVFASGTKVALSAQPDAGWTFAGWSGACSGMECSVNSGSSVTAAFTKLPPPPAARRTLSVALQGNGKVTSALAGIDCGTACSASFDDGARVALTAQPDSGWTFSGFSGACSGATCSVSMSADQSVTATFTAVKPADECDGLLPSALPAPVVADLPQNSCLDGTSDDGTGTFLLGYTAGSAGPNYPNYLFFTIQDGKAVRTGDTVPGGTNSTTAVFSQPSGFTAVRYYGFDGASGLMNYDHLGKLQSSPGMVAGSFDHAPSSHAAIDPSGGTAVLSHSYDSGTQTWTTAYKRFDKTGALETGPVVVDHETHDARGIGIALSGHVLIFVSQSSTAWRARWLARDGSALTDWFTLEGAAGEFPATQFLMDGSLLVGSRPNATTWKYMVRDGKAAVEALPDWIAQRNTNMFFVVRGGRAYATWGSGGSCSGSLEVLATSGKSCGCLKVPNLKPWGEPYSYGRYSTAGRDGSLIVPRDGEQFGTCHYDLYPQLLK